MVITQRGTAVIEHELTVILPAAGEGNRLGLDTPKELLELIPGVRLIDFSLRHIRAAAGKKHIQVAVVTRPWKASVVEYVKEQLPGIKVEAVLFNDMYHEWPGSVYSANEFFSADNLVLLPDSYLSLATDSPLETPAITGSGGKTLAELVSAALSRHGVVFGCISCTDKERLRSLGAVRIENRIITAFQDKPGSHEEKIPFNGFWGCYAFRKEMGKPLYDFLAHSVRHRSLPLQAQTFYPMGIIPVARYEDLGTWENIEKFKKEKSD